MTEINVFHVIYCVATDRFGKLYNNNPDNENPLLCMQKHCKIRLPFGTFGDSQPALVAMIVDK